ncbi:MAG TPA: YdaS family helix-turn-helix protein [Acidimicrobiia bacterium]
MIDRLAVQRAIDAAGGQSALARAIGISQPSVWFLRHRAVRVRWDTAARIARATGVQPHELDDSLPRVEVG